MKKLFLATAIMFLVVVATTFGQSLEKGNLVGLHKITLHLDPDVTMNQYKEFVLTKYIPASNKNFPGMTTFLLEGKRGEDENGLGLLFLFNSEEDRNKYFNDDGTSTELLNTGNQKMQSINEEIIKLGTWTSVYTDWIVQ